MRILGVRYAGMRHLRREEEKRGMTIVVIGNNKRGEIERGPKLPRGNLS